MRVPRTEIDCPSRFTRGAAWGSLGLLVAACCFGGSTAPPATASRAPQDAAVAPTAESTAAAIDAAVAAARAADLTPEERLSRAETTVALPLPTVQQLAAAHGYLDALPAAFEPTRQRAARRALVQEDRRAGEQLVAGARANIEAGMFDDARTAIAAIPEGTPSARQRTRLLAQVDREEAREAAHAARRGPAPSVSAWDGAAHAVTTYLRHVAHDPDSIDIDQCGPVQTSGDYYTQDCIYRGANAFGATVVNANRFFIQQETVVRTTALH
jgi:hypothetical protein